MKKMLKFYKNTKQKMKCLVYYWVIIQLKNKNPHHIRKTQYHIYKLIFRSIFLVSVCV